MASGYSDLSEIRRGNSYGLHNKPPKINLINEQPRRESIVEQQLSSTLTRANTNYYTSPQILPASTQFRQQQQLQQQQQQQQQQLQQQQVRSQAFGGGPVDVQQRQVTTTHQQQSQWSASNAPSAPGMIATASASQDDGRGLGHGAHAGTSVADYYAELERDLAQKEARLKREIAHLNQQLSPWARPRQIREPRREPEPKYMRNDQRWVKECPSTSSSRPNSRASSTRSNAGADLMDKASKLLQDAEDLEKKPLKVQSILIEDGAKRRSTSPAPKPLSSGVSSIHTAIITVPNHEPDNKSPLPIAFDNFSTLGVRGNIASIGAAPPETPYPPIFPVVKRTPSPMHTIDRRR